ncbi:MAG TPA: hypothetical protein VIT89_03675 [Solirubrobacterales bacterium]
MVLPEKPENQEDLLRHLRETLSDRLPSSWEIDLSKEPQYGRTRPDATLRLRGPDGSERMLLIEAKSTINARDVPAVIAQLKEMQSQLPTEDLGPPIVISRYMAPRTRAMLAEAEASYVDATGNVRIVVDRPAIYLEDQGAKSDPWRGSERETRTLRGKPAAKVVRGLVDFRAPMGIRELASRSGASIGSTYRTVAFLEKEALLTRGEKGNVASVDWRTLLLRWSEDYSFQTTNRILAALEPRGMERILENLERLNGKARYAVTGALSANRVSQVASPRLATILTPEPEQLFEDLQLREGAGAPNVLLARPFDDVLLARSEAVGGITYAAFSQTAVDLLTSPGRGPVEAEALLSWMAANEGAWRG